MLYSQSPQQLCLEISISPNTRNLYSLKSSVTVHCTGERRKKPDRKPYHLPYGLRNPYRNHKSETSQDNAQKPQPNCTFMNSASALVSHNMFANLYGPIMAFYDYFSLVIFYSYAVKNTRTTFLKQSVLFLFSFKNELRSTFIVDFLVIIDCFLLVSFKGGEKKHVGETVVVGPYIVYPSDNELLSLTMCLTVSPFAFFLYQLLKLKRKNVGVNIFI